MSVYRLNGVVGKATPFSYAPYNALIFVVGSIFHRLQHIKKTAKVCPELTDRLFYCSECAYILPPRQLLKIPVISDSDFEVIRTTFHCYFSFSLNYKILSE